MTLHVAADLNCICTLCGLFTYILPSHHRRWAFLAYGCAKRIEWSRFNPQPTDLPRSYMWMGVTWFCLGVAAVVAIALAMVSASLS
jgi:hypothetical protein